MSSVIHPVLRKQDWFNKGRSPGELLVHQTDRCWKRHNNWQHPAFCPNHICRAVDSLQALLPYPNCAAAFLGADCPLASLLGAKKLSSASTVTCHATLEEVRSTRQSRAHSVELM